MESHGIAASGNGPLEIYVYSKTAQGADLQGAMVAMASVGPVEVAKARETILKTGGSLDPADTSAFHVIDESAAELLAFDRFRLESVLGSKLTEAVEIHYFDSTGEAYDAANCDLDIEAVICVPDEGVVGQSWAWPIAVTEAAGEMHHIENGKQEAVLKDAGFTPESIEVALALAADYGMGHAEWVKVMRGEVPAKTQSHRPGM